jgi:peptidyl-prolyl cis-trans isomerase A (cyclophilin A)
MMALLMTISSACTKSCKGQGPNTALPSHEKDLHTNNKDQEKIMESKEKEKLIKDFSLKPGDKLIAEFDTTGGTIKAELFWQEVPITVDNFVSLALGKKEWIHPATQEKLTKPLYDNTIFHRVIKGFMIQGGDPMGSGIGGPGYKFKDEFHPSLKHNKKGILSMANAGPNTNGSQFFITEGPTSHLDNRHSVFGQVNDEESLNVVSAIANTPTGERDKPLKDITIKSIKVYKN